MEQLTIDVFSKGEAMMQRAYDFKEEHPKAYEWFLHEARQLAAHQRKFGIQLLAEGYRWEHRMEDTDKEYKINNTTLAGLSRLMCMDAPEIKPWITMRSSVCDTVV